jgi:hypothetical protein
MSFMQGGKDSAGFVVCCVFVLIASAAAATAAIRIAP